MTRLFHRQIHHQADDCFAAGVTLESLTVNTVDASGTAAFSVGGLAERMRKSAKLARLAVYFDVGAASDQAGGFGPMGKRIPGRPRRRDGARRRFRYQHTNRHPRRFVSTPTPSPSTRRRRGSTC